MPGWTHTPTSEIPHPTLTPGAKYVNSFISNLRGRSKLRFPLGFKTESLGIPRILIWFNRIRLGNWDFRGLPRTSWDWEFSLHCSVSLRWLSTFSGGYRRQLWRHWGCRLERLLSRGFLSSGSYRLLDGRPVLCSEGDASSDHSVVLSGDASSQEWRRWKEEKMLQGQTRTNAVTKDCRSTYKYLILGVPLNAHFNTLEHFHQALGSPRTSQDFPRTS